MELLKVWRERRVVRAGQVIITVHRRARIVLKMGHNFEVEDVLNLEETLELLKERYFRR